MKSSLSGKEVSNKANQPAARISPSQAKLEIILQVSVG